MIVSSYLYIYIYNFKTILLQVEQIVGKKLLSNRRVLYRVRWRGFSTDHDSWEPASNLGSCRKLLDWYNDDGDNSVVKEDGQISTIRAEKLSPGKLNGNIGTQTQEAEEKKKDSKNDIPKSKKGNRLSTPNKINKNLKENQKTSSASQTQIDLPSSTANLTSSTDKFKSKKRKLSDRAQNNKITAVNSNSDHQTQVLKKRPSNDKTDVQPSESFRRLNPKRKPQETGGKTNNAENTTDIGPPLAKKLKLQNHKDERANSNVNASNNSSSNIVEDVVDLTLSETSSDSRDNRSDEIEISDEDEDVLYSLISHCDNMSTDKDVETSNNNTDNLKSKNTIENSKASVIPKPTSQPNSVSVSDGTNQSKLKGKSKKKRMSLMDSKNVTKSFTGAASSGEDFKIMCVRFKLNYKF